MTPTQAIAAGVPRDAVMALSQRKSGKTKLVPETQTPAGRAFGKNN
jgi:hypothetical protein